MTNQRNATLYYIDGLRKAWYKANLSPTWSNLILRHLNLAEHYLSLDDFGAVHDAVDSGWKYLDVASQR